MEFTFRRRRFIVPLLDETVANEGHTAKKRQAEEAEEAKDIQKTHF